MSETPDLPKASELFNKRALVARHPFLSEHRVEWATRMRHTNGLADAGAVFESPCGELIVHEPKFLAWFLGLAGRKRPRATRRRARA